MNEMNTLFELYMGMLRKDENSFQRGFSLGMATAAKNRGEITQEQIEALREFCFAAEYPKAAA